MPVQHPVPVWLLFLTTLLCVHSKEMFEQGGRGQDGRYLDARSGRDSDRSIRKILDTNSIRFGRRSDLPPIPDRLQFDVDPEDIQRIQRASNHHMRFGKAGSQFLRFGRSQNDTPIEGVPRFNRGNNHFLRLGRGNGGSGGSYMRFGRGDNYMRFGRDSKFMRFGRNPFKTSPESRLKRDTSELRKSGNFMRFGRGDYEEEIEGVQDGVDYPMREFDDVPLATFLNEIACKMDNANCDSQ